MLFCVWTANSLKKSCPNPFSCTWCWRPQITIWSACVLRYISRVCYKHSVDRSCKESEEWQIPRAPYSWFATSQVLCSDTLQCYNCAVVSSCILDTHRHGKSQVVPVTFLPLALYSLVWVEYLVIPHKSCWANTIIYPVTISHLAIGWT
jgi:hypothetical protein